MAHICEKFDRIGADDPQRRFRLGIMGGTFDPIHFGHLICAEQVRNECALDAVIFIPAGNPSFKQNQRIAPATDRLAMCKCAVANNSAFDVSPIEIQRSGITYSVDTLNAFRAWYPPNVDFYFIVGADAFASIEQWYRSSEIAHLAHIIAATRPGCAIDDVACQSLVSRSDFDVNYVPIPEIAISSSMIRHRCEQHQSIRYLVPDSVASYIDEHHLYEYVE
ncbi:MAG: nicotinate-nucleotide adenylyltransferase [Eggerthellaceae bacterium]|jgi:nicotinate-nucleotide adenylyltransferase|nr:nicotinate-nucleotide adenylyltransferase [Eggerthellaceae bacterium]MCH4220345.1 nicotinate-nucleotide adenylyltransferase [Eggerthellaceae bacterium]